MSSPTHDEIMKTACELCGVNRACYFGFEFTGQQYLIMLYAMFPKAVDLNKICWLLNPISAQLDANIQYFLQCAKSLNLDAFPDSITDSSMLNPLPQNAPYHIEVLLWIWNLSQQFPKSFDFDPVELLRQHAPKYTVCPEYVPNNSNSPSSSPMKEMEQKIEGMERAFNTVHQEMNQQFLLRGVGQVDTKEFVKILESAA